MPYLDYCHVICGLSMTLTDAQRQQHVQNSCFKLIYGLRKELIKKMRPIYRGFIETTFTTIHQMAMVKFKIL